MDSIKKFLRSPSVYLLLLIAVIVLIGVIVKRNKNTVMGQMRWNEQPLEGMDIVLFQGGCDERPPIARTVTDSSGHYQFDHVEPGTYVLGVNGWSTDKRDLSIGSNLLYPIACYQPFTLESGKVVVQDLDLVRTDLVILAPSESLVTEKPIFSWKEYPDASYYEIRVFQVEDNRGTALFTERTIYAENELSQSLEQGIVYHATITAYNANGVPIASQNTINFRVTSK